MAMTLQQVQGNRRIYASDRADFEVHITEIAHERRANDLMSLWVENGRMPAFVERTLSVDTFYTDGDGQCCGRFNPQVKHDGARPVIDFAWMLEATPENERLILGECERLMLEFENR